MKKLGVSSKAYLPMTSSLTPINYLPFSLFPPRFSAFLEGHCYLVAHGLLYLISKVNEPNLVYFSFQKPVLISIIVSLLALIGSHPPPPQVSDLP